MQEFPTLTEEETEESNGDSPQYCPRHVVNHELTPGHPRRAGEERREHSQTRYKACEQNRFVAVPREKLVEFVQPLVREKYIAAIPLKSRASDPMPDGITGVVAEHRTDGGNDNHHPQMKMALRGKEACRKENSLAGHRHSGVLQHHAEEDYEVAIASEVVEQDVEQRFSFDTRDLENAPMSGR